MRSDDRLFTKAVLATAAASALTANASAAELDGPIAFDTLAIDSLSHGKDRKAGKGREEPQREVSGPMAFDPISGSAYAELTMDAMVLNSEPWVIPGDFEQYIVSDETDLDIYVGNDWNDMNTVNETRKHAGRYLYRTHEVRPVGDDDANSRRNDGGSGGAVSVVDLRTGKTKEVVGRADWEALDGILWTPWHTILFAEEVNAATRPDPNYPLACCGLVYELQLDKKDPTTAKSVTARPLLGSMSHEGIETDTEGNVYVIDEDRKPNGQIYRFVPDEYGDLSSGTLYALKVANGAQTGEAEWVELDLDPVTFNAEEAAKAAGATGYCRPEDLERIGQTLYAALTCEDVNDPLNPNGAGAVLSITLDGAPQVNYFVKHGENVDYEDPANGITGFKSPDNLADGPDGKLWIVEDNVPSDIWVAEPDNDGDGYSDGVHLFASLKDDGAEGTGIYFGKDPRTLFVNIQHSATGNDKTMAITNR
jgi:hypothetical protein